MRVTNFVEAGCGVGAAAGVVEAQGRDDRLATVVISQVELPKRRRRVRDSGHTHVAGVDVQTVRNVSSEHHRVIVLLLYAARDVQHEHNVHLLATTCIAYRDYTLDDTIINTSGTYVSSQKDLSWTASTVWELITSLLHFSYHTRTANPAGLTTDSAQYCFIHM